MTTHPTFSVTRRGTGATTGLLKPLGRVASSGGSWRGAEAGAGSGRTCGLERGPCGELGGGGREGAAARSGGGAQGPPRPAGVTGPVPSLPFPSLARARPPSLPTWLNLPLSGRSGGGGGGPRRRAAMAAARTAAGPEPKRHRLPPLRWPPTPAPRSPS